MTVPSQPEPVTGDVQEGPSATNTDVIHNIPLVDQPHVSPPQPNDNCVSLYAVGHDKDRFQRIRPFIHSVELKGKKGITTAVEGLFDEGALVNSICNSKFALLRDRLGDLLPSSKTLLMADGARVPSSGRWIGDVGLGD